MFIQKAVIDHSSSDSLPRSLQGYPKCMVFMLQTKMCARNAWPWKQNNDKERKTKSPNPLTCSLLHKNIHTGRTESTLNIKQQQQNFIPAVFPLFPFHLRCPVYKPCLDCAFHALHSAPLLVYCCHSPSHKPHFPVSFFHCASNWFLLSSTKYDNKALP